MLENKLGSMRAQVESMNPDQLLNSSEDDLVSALVKECRVEPISLAESDIYVDQVETQIDVSGDRDRHIRDRSRPFHISGTANKFFVPFSGDSGLFHCRPSTFTSASPIGDVSGNELVLTYTSTGHDAQSIRTQFDRDLAEINRYLQWIKSDVASHNRGVQAEAQVAVKRRKEKILANRGLVSSLGFPMRQRTNAPKTYVAPEIKRKPAVRLPTASTAAFKPEPTLDTKEYEHILSVIDNMVLVMERSPRAFAGMQEEDLRQHFLVQLNGQYEGQATGETFNYEGKTDILIRAEGRNVFIAECKFWRGEKMFAETLDQILGYVSWRDTKTAVLLFNRNKDFSGVLETAKGAIAAHPNFKHFVEYRREAGWRTIFHHRDDRNRELTVTVHAYDVPTKIET
ncbi:hypothetical protein [Dyella sp.]|uniref:hypothetical protein n=1 Tax=Dyella sp. TaxID=1869338 RepID=UPI002B47DD19|nr:hypothetical protein [Dyella sp.]HKT30726.1 hypothetical protein [Dyella sp.]